jgi:hypothetical protein
MTIEAGYLGNHSLFLVDGDPGLNYNQLPASYAALGNQLYNQVTNPFYGVITSSNCALSSQTLTYNYLLAPYPQYCGVQAFRKPTATSMYHAWTLRLNKRFTNGLTFLVSFTGAKMMDDAAAAVTYLGPVSGTREDQYNGHLEWSISPQDISRQMVASFVYELPFGKGKKFANGAPRGANLLVSGWQANGIISWGTGTPIVLSGAQNSMAALFAFGQRPDNNGQSAKLSDPTIARWFNTSVFSQPPLFTFGDTSRTLPDVRNPGISTANLSLFKNNYFGPDNKYNLQFRAEAQNALNHPQFGGPDVNITDGTFGQINGSANAARQIQLALKFNF